MISELIQLLVLFFVIFDPPVSFAVFSVATKEMSVSERKRTAFLAIGVAAALSYLVLFFGNDLLKIFSTNIDDFKVAGGLVLGVMGLQMALGRSVTESAQGRSKNVQAVAAIIATPFITGPAAITTIIVVSNDFGIIMTGIAVTVILALSAILFLSVNFVKRVPNIVPLQVISTLLGIITLAWGVKFIRDGLGI